MTTTFSSRQTSYKIYFFSTAALGFVLMAFCYYQTLLSGLDTRWMVLAALTLMVASFTLKIPGLNSKISVADTFIMINLIFFGPAVGCITAALEAFAGSLRSSTVSRRLEFTLFNMGNGAICAYLSGLIYFQVLGSAPLCQAPTIAVADLLVAAVILALAYYLLNSGTVALMLALESRKGFCGIWRANFLLYSLNYFASAFGAALIALNGNLITLINLLAAGLVVTILYAAYRILHGKLAARIPA